MIVNFLIYFPIYFIVSCGICAHEGYNFKRPLRKEIARGVKGLAMELITSDLAYKYLAPMGDEFRVKNCVQYLVAWDFIVFCMHYLFHQNDWLYRNVHKHHHETIYVSPFSSTIITLSEHALVGIVPIIVPLFYINMSVVAWTLMNTLIFIYGMVIHSTLKTPWDGVFLGPNEHATHHIYKQTHFGFFLPMWDYLLGTGMSTVPRERLVDSIIAAY
jgi:sterol desaturase/sphingolipid hydroxylase (fatty acid hydroxylase superfamily)